MYESYEIMKYDFSVDRINAIFSTVVHVLYFSTKSTDFLTNDKAMFDSKFHSTISSVIAKSIAVVILGELEWREEYLFVEAHIE